MHFGMPAKRANHTPDLNVSNSGREMSSRTSRRTSIAKNENKGSIMQEIFTTRGTAQCFRVHAQQCHMLGNSASKLCCFETFGGVATLFASDIHSLCLKFSAFQNSQTSGNAPEAKIRTTAFRSNAFQTSAQVGQGKSEIGKGIPDTIL